ncbi:MAG: hypothetical protein ACI35V_02935 [Sphingobacterium composti]|uniref:hypothetical protein n=1 Tax=Sphingobacterium composti TaxID=363260 RepID=UPI00135A2F5E|nr:hypothetical protein [Sphingobacterium composti Ten et al. 2007 non Yoo et al. 2007]
MNTIHFGLKNSLSILLISLLLFSCSKSEEISPIKEEAFVNLNIEGLNYESDSEILANTKNNSAVSNDLIITQYTNDGLAIESKLSNANTLNSKIKNIKSNSIAALSQLQDRVKYLMLVYDERGKLITSREYTYKQESIESAILLFSNVSYTFVIVSARSTSFVPTIKNMNSLKDATIENVDADLLYWKKKTTLTKGNNFLAANLKPLFSEVTTTIQMDQNMTGTITAINNTIFHPVSNGVSLKLTDGSAIYGNINTAGKRVSFPSLGNGVRKVTSVPTTLLHSSTTAGYFNLGSIQVDGDSKNNIKVPNLNIKPGHRYNLVLTLKTCTEAVSGLNGFNWEFPEATKTINEGGFWTPRYVTYTGINVNGEFKKNGEVISFQFTEAGADYGFVYDILELDNAFNLEINGQPLFGTSVSTSEIQFQNNATSTTQNIEFEDGSQYQSMGNTNIPADKRVKAIWEFKGTVAKPAVRVVIGRNGDVLMYGSKTDQGTLFPLRLKNNAKFNTVKWNGGSATNIIKATTRVEGKTVMKSSGSGRKKVTCKN